MRFLVEQRYLTDPVGTFVADSSLIVRSRDGRDAEAVLASFLADDGATGIGTVTRYRGDQALIFARKAGALYAVYAHPEEGLAAGSQVLII